MGIFDFLKKIPAQGIESQSIANDLKTIQGTQEQKDILARIDEAMSKPVELKINETHKNTTTKSADIFETQAMLSEKIRTNYAKRNDDPKYLDAAIKACEEQIAIAKNVAKKTLEGEKQFTLKSDQEILNGTRKNYKGTLPEGFNPDIHKSPDDFIVIPGKLGEHIGYKQLCIIREAQGNFAEVIRLAEQAKSEGWAGDWDKRIEKAKKKLETK